MDGRPRLLPLGALEGVVLGIDEVLQCHVPALSPVHEVVSVNQQM